MSPDEPPSSVAWHYGWLIVLAGTLGIFACLGLGRFALGMLLPAMGLDLHLSYAQMGAISTANFLGYLSGILAAPLLARRLGARVLITLALGLSGLSMAGVGLASQFPWIIVLYLLTGVGSALANIPIMAVLAAWFAPHLRGKAAGIVVSGSGAAIVLSGLAVPWLNGLTSQGWRLSWMVLGGLVCGVSLFCLLIVRNRPQDRGLAPAGASSLLPEGQPHRLGRERSLPLGLVLHCGAIYAIFGCTFVTYATFIVTTLVQDYGFSQQAAGSFWSWVGVLSLFSGPLFGALGDRLGRRQGLMVVLAIQTLAYLLAGLHLNVFSLYLSIGCFGIVAWSIPSIMAALAGDYAGPDKALAFFSAITFLFALGQVTGPFLAGVLAERTGTFATGYLLAAGLTTVGVLLASSLPPLSRDRK